MYDHMGAGGEEREVKVQLVAGEHPFVVLRQLVSPRFANSGGLTIDIDSENRYHNPINDPLINPFFTTCLSASFFSSSDISDNLTSLDTL